MRKRESELHASTVERRHARHVDLPLPNRLRARIGRAVAKALVDPVKSMPTLRRAVREAHAQLLAQGFTEAGIQARLSLLVQAIALDGGLDERSVVTRRPRWQELSDRIAQWIAEDEA